MKFLTKRKYKIGELAKMALDAELYESPAWTMITCYRDIIRYDDIAKSSELLLLQTKDEKLIGSIFFNDKYSDNYWGTNIQMYIKPEFRGKGLATAMYKKMNLALNSRHFKGILFSGYGISGSDTFWNKMSKLHKTDDNCRKLHFYG